MTERLQSTALFTTLRAIHTGSLSSDLPASTISELILSPREALSLPSPEEMTARFGSDLRTSDIRTIYEDLGVERDALEGLLVELEGGGMWAEVAGLEERTRERSVGAAGDFSYEEEVSEEMEVVEGLGLSGADIDMDA